MSNPSKAKGTRFEVDVVEFLRTHGFPHCERRALRGVNDAGDIAGIVGWSLEAKNCRTMDLAGWMGEAQRQAANAKVYLHAVIHKRRGKNVRDAYVTLPLWAFVALLADDPAEVAS